MSNNTIHSIRFSDAVYGVAKGTYIDCSVRICTHKVTAVVALKAFVGSFSKTPYRHDIVWLVGHNFSIISDRAKWLEFLFCLFRHGVRCIGNLGNRSYHQLRRNLKFGPDRIIDLVMQSDFIENRFLICHLRNVIVGSIRYFHSLKEKCGLILCRQQLDFQS